MTRIEVEVGAVVHWVPLQLLGTETRHGYQVQVRDVRRRTVIVQAGQVRVHVAAGELQEREEDRCR